MGGEDAAVAADSGVDERLRVVGLVGGDEVEGLTEEGEAEAAGGEVGVAPPEREAEGEEEDEEGEEEKDEDDDGHGHGYGAFLDW